MMELGEGGGASRGRQALAINFFARPLSASLQYLTHSAHSRRCRRPSRHDHEGGLRDMKTAGHQPKKNEGVLQENARASIVFACKGVDDEDQKQGPDRITAQPGSAATPMTRTTKDGMGWHRCLLGSYR